MFTHFETTSTREREDIARNLKTLYNRFYTEENESFLTMRQAKTPAAHAEAQKKYIAAVSKLGAVQAVFTELGITFDGLYELKGAD